MANKSRIAESYMQVVPVVSDLAEELTDQIVKGYEEAAEKARDKTLPVPEVDEGEWEDSGRKSAKALGGALIAGLAAFQLGAMVAEQFRSAMEVQDVNAKLAGALALNPEEEARLYESIKSVYGSAYGESYEEVAAAMKAIVSTVDGARNMTSEELTKMGKDVLNLSATFGYSAEEIAKSSQIAIANGLASDWESAQILILNGFQKFGEQGDDWLDSINEFSDDLVKFGFTGAEAIQLIEAAMASGMKETDVLVDSLNELGIKLTDGTSWDAISALGLDPQAIAAAVRQGGQSAQSAFTEVLTRIQKAGDQGGALGAAIFGTRFEDYQTAFMTMDLSNVNTQLEGVTGTMSEFDSTVNNSANVSLVTFQRTFETAFMATIIPILEAVTPLLQQMAIFFQENEWAAQLLGIAVGGILVTALIAGTAAMWSMVPAAWALLAPFLPAIGVFLAVAAAIVAVTTAFANLMGWSGSDYWRNFGTGLDAIFNPGKQAPMPHGFATGGTVLPRDGGTLGILAEAGRAETIVDTGNVNQLIEGIINGNIDTAGSSGNSIQITIIQQPNEDTGDLVRKIQEYLEFNGLTGEVA